MEMPNIVPKKRPEGPPELVPVPGSPFSPDTTSIATDVFTWLQQLNRIAEDIMGHLSGLAAASTKYLRAEHNKEATAMINSYREPAEQSPTTPITDELTHLEHALEHARDLVKLLNSEVVR